MQSPLITNPIWQNAIKCRRLQRLAGRLSAILLFAAMAGLFDGLLAQMRSGSNELELLSGQSLSLSGPAAIKNPVSSDVLASFSPPDAPVKFELEGFFTGYWFGSGMWRGSITALPDAPEGRYELKISFRGASALNAQKYVILVFDSVQSMRKNSHSLLKRALDVNPFILAAICGCAGIVGGICTFFYGRRFAIALSHLGLAEIYRSEPGFIWCLAPKPTAPLQRDSLPILDAAGSHIGSATKLEWRKGSLKLSVLQNFSIPSGSFVSIGFRSKSKEGQTFEKP